MTHEGDEDRRPRSEQAVQWFVTLQECDDEAVWLAHREWLEADPANETAYARAEACWIAAEDPNIREAFDAGPRSQNHELSPKIVNLSDGYATRTARIRAMPWIPVAAAASIAAVVAWPVITRHAPVPSVAYRTDADHARDIVLSDGTRVTLNRDSVLTVRINGGTRAVTLASGEAAFDVRHDAAHPFTVAVAGREVRVLGTAFGVTLRDGALGVAVLRGAVSVSAAQGSGPTIVLPAGKALSRLRGSPQDQIADIAPDNALAWKNRELSYTGATLATVARDYERMIGQPVEVDPTIRDLSVSGILRAADEQELIRQIELVLPVRVVRTPSGRRIVRKAGS